MHIGRELDFTGAELMMSAVGVSVNSYVQLHLKTGVWTFNLFAAIYVKCTVLPQSDVGKS